MYVQLLVDLIVGYIALFIIVKILGKTQLSQITPFDFISALVLGELVGNAIFDKQAGILAILLTVVVWGTLIYITEILTQKSRRLRYILEGRPAMLIQKGKLDWKELKKNKIDIDQLQQLLRSKDVFSLQDVEYAILENNGEISVLRKPDADQPTCKDLQVKGKQRTIPLTVISDGEVLLHNLQKAGVSNEWLDQELKKKGINRPKDISYAEYDSSGNLFLQTY